MVWIDPAAITTIRTSIERVLAQGGAPVPVPPFRAAEDIPAYWRAAESLHGRGDLAVCVARELPVGTFGRTSYAFASAASIGEALAVFRRDSQRAVEGLRTVLENKAGVSTLTLEGAEVLAPMLDVLIAVLAWRGQQLAEPAVELVKVELHHPEPADIGPWTRHFVVRPRFASRRSSLAMPTEQLAQPMRTSDPTLRDMLGTRTSGSTADEVRAHVRAWIREASEISQVARSLGMSARTLQRRLDDEGVTFRSIVMDQKIEVAKQLLADARLTIAEVATAVGFARVAAFSRAFTHHTGVSPSQFQISRRTT